MDVAQKVVQRNPRDASTLNLLGVARVAVGDRKGGREAYEQAIRVDKTFTPARLNLGKLELMEGNATAARERFMAILKEAPNDVQAMYELARLEDGAGDVSGALRWLEKLHATTRRNVPGAVYLVDVYLRTGQPNKAIEVAKDAEAIAPRDLNVLAALGRTYLSLGDEKLARDVFTRMAGHAELDAQWQYNIAQYQLRPTTRKVQRTAWGKPWRPNPTSCRHRSYWPQ